MSNVLMKYGKLFERHANGKQVKCGICNCWLPSAAEKFLESHIIGKKHKQQVEKVKKKNAVLKQSVYVKGFDAKFDNLEDELTNYFTELNVAVVDVYVDKNSGSYAIVQFENEDSVKHVLNQPNKNFHGSKLIVKERHLPSQKVDNTSASNNILDTYLLPSSLVTLLQEESKIENQFTALYSFYKLKNEDLELRKLICELVQNVLEEVYSGCQVILFGSTVNGLGGSGCDIDMTVVIDNENFVEEENEILKNIRELLERFAPGCKNVTLVETSKTCKLIKFHHTEGNVNIDLSLNNRLAIENTDMLKTYIDLHPSISILLFTVRKFFKCHDLIGRTTQQISNYALTIMFLHFLQQKYQLSCLQNGAQHDLKENIIDQWNCAFSKECSYKSDLLEHKGQLMSSFFNYIASFNYNENVFAIHVPHILTREKCIEIARDSGYDNLLKSNTPLLIQDPFKLSHNLTHYLSMDGLKHIIEISKYAIEKSSSAKENILELFAPFKNIKTRTKQKHQRNRSNVYNITLPQCQDCYTKEEFNCLKVVERILREDLKMDLCLQNDLSDTIVLQDNTKTDTAENVFNVRKRKVIEIPKLDNVSKKIKVELDDFPESDKQHMHFSEKIGSKEKVCCSENIEVKFKSSQRKNDTGFEETEQFNEKKCKNVKEKHCISFVARAYTDTWTNRRKQRRLQNKVTINNETNELSANIAENSNNESPKKNSESNNEPSPDETASCEKNDKIQELLNFQIKITPSMKKDDMCIVTLAPTDMTKNIHMFQTFYAFFKKELISNFR